MSNSILVTKTPKSCSQCDLFEGWSGKRKDGKQYISCMVAGGIEKTDEYLYNVRPPQCPLQDTTELLRTMERLGRISYKQNVMPSGVVNLRVSTNDDFIEIHKALGGQDE